MVSAKFKKYNQKVIKAWNLSIIRNVGFSRYQKSINENQLQINTQNNLCFPILFYQSHTFLYIE